jgi:phosphotransacetylase
LSIRATKLAARRCRAAEAGIIKPILVGPSAKIKAVASKHGIEIGAFELVDALTAKPPPQGPLSG